MGRQMRDTCQAAGAATCWIAPDVTAVVGGVSSPIAVAISRMFSYYQIPIVSPSATSVELSDKVNTRTSMIVQLVQPLNPFRQRCCQCTNEQVLLLIMNNTITS